jgi:hypothetical protein
LFIANLAVSSCVLIPLPRPSPKTQRPTEVTTQANVNGAVTVNKFKDDNKGFYGAYYTTVLKYDDQTEGNPWKIRSLKIHSESTSFSRA